jgi:hypothetical protein
MGMGERHKRPILKPHYDLWRLLTTARTPTPPREGQLRAFTEVRTVFSELLADVVQAEAMDLTRQTGRRTYARAIFALIEAVNHCQHATTQMQPGLAPEIRERLREAPGVTWRKARLQGTEECPFLRSTVGCVAAFAIYFGCPSPIHMTATPWDQLTRAAAVRVRIKAPPRHQDCLVSDEELDLLRVAHRWYQGIGEQLLRCAADVLHKRDSLSTAGNAPAK